MPVGGCPGTVVGCLGPIGCSSCAIALGAQENVFATRVRVVLLVVQTSQCITALGAAVTKGGSLITSLRGPKPRRGTLVAQHCYGPTVATRPPPRQSGAVIAVRVATCRVIHIGGVLILVGASLIPLASCLVVIRPGLILITRGLVAIARIADLIVGTG